MASWRFCKKQGPTDLVCNRIDGHNGQHAWTEPIIEQPRPDLAIDRARELGAKHGTLAAELWLARETRADGLGSLTKYPRSMVAGFVSRGAGGQLHAWPEPDLTTRSAREMATDSRLAYYCTAFRTARDETIRAACQ